MHITFNADHAAGKERSPNSVAVEDGVDTVVLTCLADGNPKPDIVWRKLGKSSIFRFDEHLRFEPVRKADTGTYICQARNVIGASDEISANIEVNFPPRKVRTEPSDFLDLEVGTRHVFTCDAEGSPLPDFEWLHRYDEHDGETTAFKLGTGSTIVLENVTYEHEGLWWCTAFNRIKGATRKEQSPVLRVGVSGKPLVQSDRQTQPRSLIQAKLQEQADLEVMFCADPPPRKVRWEWEGRGLEAGRRRGRISVAKLQSLERKDCYTSKISFNPVTAEDAGTYYLVAENDRGTLRSGVSLSVADPISMSTVIGVAISCLILVSALLICLVCSQKHRKCCFQDTGHFEPQDIRIERRRVEPEQDERNVDRPSDQQTLPSGLGTS